MTQKKYDVIVVGAGIAGLFCANLLAKYGKKTLLLEHNHQPGGLMGGFRRKNFYFDAGDQSFESGGVIFPILKELGFYRPEDWEITDYTMAFPNGTVVMKDQDKAVEELADIYPHMRDEMYNMFSNMMGYAEILGAMSNDDTSPLGRTGLDRVKAIAGMIKSFSKYGKKMKELENITVPEHIDKYLPPSIERDRFVNMGYRNMPVLLGTGFWYTWFNDYWYYKRGQQGLMDDLAKLFTENGGVLECNHTVDQVLTNKDKVKGVKTKDNDYYEADKVVFTGAMKRLYTELLDPEYLDPEMVDRIKKAEVSDPLFSVYLGVDMTHEELSKYLDTHHTLYFPDGPVPNLDDMNNEKMHDGGMVEITWTSMRCPELAPENKNSLVLQSFTNCNWLDRWGTGGDDFSRPERYKEIKNMVANVVIDTAAMKIPGLKDRIIYKDSGTPLSTVRFTLNPDGASCGWNLELEKSFLKDNRAMMTTPYEGLLAAGHYSLWPGGVPIAALSGVIAAWMIKYNTTFKVLKKARGLFKN